MKLLVFSHKKCWKSQESLTGWATDGGFAMHMDYLSKLFTHTKIIVPVVPRKEKGEVFFNAQSIEIIPVKLFFKKGLLNKLFMPFWFLYYLPKFIRLILNSDAIHTPIPSNIGTIGFLLAHLFNKPLYIRHCGNWFVQRSTAERFWHWYMGKFAGGKKVFLTTGGSDESPSKINSNIKWIFSSSLTIAEIEESTCLSKNWSSPNRICIVCRQEKGKGTELVLEALKKFKDIGQMFYFDIVGDGSYLNELKEITNNLQLNNQVIFHGKLNHSEVLEVLQQNHFFVYPTASEGFPKVVLEAMSQQLIVVTTAVSVLGGLIQDSKAGVILKERTAEEVVKQLELLLSEDVNLPKLSANAIAYSKQFTLENWANEIGKHLEHAWNVELKKVKV
jgi:glycosyltransferase involved in cell wall biosynthesis